MYIKPLMPTGLAVNVKIMPEFFKDEGYTTHAIGKWHLGFCHQNYTPTYRGFDSFYGFYLGAEDYYTHGKYITYENVKIQKKGGSFGYDFRFNEKILRGPEVVGKYSADLFVNRAKAVFEEHKALEDAGKGKPWFTYLSFQSVHDPLQVPHTYKQNVCQYKDTSRYFYSAMVSSLDHSMDLVVQALKANNMYDNTIIVFTTDNGGAVQYGGNNMPLRGTKGTLFEGGTRGIGFIHSPLLKSSGHTASQLMHAVDWVPTLMSAVGRPLASDMTGGEVGAERRPIVKGEARLDGLDLWGALGTAETEGPREEVVYNVKEKPFMAAIRVGDYKMIWGSRTTKDTWFEAKEEPINKFVCKETMRTRSKLNRSRILLPRGVETMDVLKLDLDEDVEYEDDYDNIETFQEKNGGLVSDTLSVLSSLGERFGRAKEEGKWKLKGEKRNKKKGSGKRKKNEIIQNKFGVQIKTFGKVQLFNLKEDPEERNDISGNNTDIIGNLKERVKRHFYHLYPRQAPDDTEAGDPKHWGGYYGPGWCDALSIVDIVD